MCGSFLGKGPDPWVGKRWRLLVGDRASVCSHPNNDPDGPQNSATSESRRTRRAIQTEWSEHSEYMPDPCLPDAQVPPGGPFAGAGRSAWQLMPTLPAGFPPEPVATGVDGSSTSSRSAPPAAPTG